MPVRGTISPKGDSAITRSRLTLGSQPWAAAVIRALRAGYGVEDIALRLECPTEAVRDLVAKLRERGLLTSFCADARKARARGVRA